MRSHPTQLHHTHWSHSRHGKSRSIVKYRRQAVGILRIQSVSPEEFRTLEARFELHCNADDVALCMMAQTMIAGCSCYITMIPSLKAEVS